MTYTCFRLPETSQAIACTALSVDENSDPNKLLREYTDSPRHGTNTTVIHIIAALNRVVQALTKRC